MPNANKNAADIRMFQDPQGTPHTQPLITVSPPDYLEFRPDSPSRSLNATLHLVNLTNSDVFYKVQTTSPEKFRVRPRQNKLSVGETAEVCINLKQEHEISRSGRDKFLIAATMLPKPNMSMEEIAAFWQPKSFKDDDVEQHRLVCTIEGQPIGAMHAADEANKFAEQNMRHADIEEYFGTRTDAATAQAESARSSTTLHDKVNQLDRKVTFIQKAQLFTFILILLTVLVFGITFKYYLSSALSNCNNSAGSGTASRWKHEL